MRAAALAVLLAAAPAGAAEEKSPCPEGQQAVATGRADMPFRCVRDMSKGPFMNFGAGGGLRPRCPQGTVATKTALGTRCVKGESAPETLPGGGVKEAPLPLETAGPARTDAAASRGADAQLGERVLEKASGGAAGEAKASADDDLPPVPHDFTQFRARGISVAVPRGWHVTDAWKDEVPTVYIEPPTRRPGKPLTLILSRVAPGQPEYKTFDKAMAEDRQVLGAKDGKPFKVSGRTARQTVVAGESRNVYVDAGDGAYFLFGYSAPKELFAAYEPAFETMLNSARFGAR